MGTIVDTSKLYGSVCSNSRPITMSFHAWNTGQRIKMTQIKRSPLSLKNMQKRIEAKKEKNIKETEDLKKRTYKWSEPQRRYTQQSNKLLALGTGSSCPGLERDTLRIYSMRFCPFAHRTRLILEHKDIAHEIVNINTVTWPEWFLDLSPLRILPTLQFNDKILCGSEIINDYLDTVYPNKPLNPSDKNALFKQRYIKDSFKEIEQSMDFFSSTPAIKINNEEVLTKAEALLSTLKRYESLLKKHKMPFFGGVKVGMADFYMWPWFERLHPLRMLINVKHRNLFKQDLLHNHQMLNQWEVLMRNVKAVQATQMPAMLHLEFLRSQVDESRMVNDDTIIVPDFNVGLEVQPNS